MHVHNVHVANRHCKHIIIKLTDQVSKKMVVAVTVAVMIVLMMVMLMITMMKAVIVMQPT